MVCKRRLALALVTSLFLAVSAAPASFAAAYPEKNLTGFISFGAGGGTDNLSRAVTPFAEKHLGKTIVLSNKPGAVGAVAHTLVCNSPADGYTMLYQAENPSLYKILGLSSKDWDDVEPIMLFLQGITVICVTPDSALKSYEELIEALKGGKDVIMGTTGIGGLPYVAGAMMKTVHGIKNVDFAQFESDGTAATAMLGGHLEVMPMAISACLEFIRAGKLRPLVVYNPTRLPQLPDVPAVTEIYPEYGKFLPWGPFYGVFVRKGTPADKVQVLRDAFTKAMADPELDKILENFAGSKLALTGDEAVAYLKKNQSIASWLVYEVGGAKKSPAEFNIAKP